MAGVYAHREEFDLTEHRTGPNLDQSIRGILQAIERYSGIELAKPFESLRLDREMKWHAKYARQNGVHSSPTFMVNGIAMADMGSGDTIDAWLEKLGLA